MVGKDKKMVGKDKKQDPKRRDEDRDEPSKGQYGGLNGLGPGGGRDLEDAGRTEDIDDDTRKRR